MTFLWEPYLKYPKRTQGVLSGTPVTPRNTPLHLPPALLELDPHIEIYPFL